MITLRRILVGGGFALALGGLAWAGEPNAPTPVAPAPTAAPATTATPEQIAADAQHKKLMNETICRTLDEDDTGSRVHHRTCKTRLEWLDYDKRHSGSYDPNTGLLVDKH